jgi:AcrR family transcriptional regulator
MPRVVDAEQRRAELMRVTAEAIARDGLDGVTLRNVARSGGWTTGIVNHYFTDKRDLLLATFRSRADAARRRVADAMAAGATPLEALVESTLPLDDERMLNWQVWLAFWGAALGDDEMVAVQRARHDEFEAALVAGLRDSQRAGRVRSAVDPSVEALKLVALLDGIAVQAIFEPARWTPQLQRRIVDEHLAALT